MIPYVVMLTSQKIVLAISALILKLILSGIHTTWNFFSQRRKASLPLGEIVNVINVSYKLKNTLKKQILYFYPSLLVRAITDCGRVGEWGGGGGHC